MMDQLENLPRDIVIRPDLDRDGALANRRDHDRNRHWMEVQIATGTPETQPFQAGRRQQRGIDLGLIG